jgi:four helix bundle protein
MSDIRSYRDLLAWQRAFALAVAAYKICDSIPRTKRGTLAGQVERAAASVPANIAEGYGRLHRGEYLHFLGVAHGSLTELDTHLRLMSALGYGSAPLVDDAIALAGDAGRLLGGLMRALRQTAGADPAPDRRPTLPVATQTVS